MFVSSSAPTTCSTYPKREYGKLQLWRLRGGFHPLFHANDKGSRTLGASLHELSTDQRPRASRASSGLDGGRTFGGMIRPKVQDAERELSSRCLSSSLSEIQHTHTRYLRTHPISSV